MREKKSEEGKEERVLEVDKEGDSGEEGKRISSS